MMKKKKTKQRKVPRGRNRSSRLGVDSSFGRKKTITKHELDELVAELESGIRDTPAWKELVLRVGKEEAARILRVAVFSRHAICPEPNN